MVVALPFLFAGASGALAVASALAASALWRRAKAAEARAARLEERERSDLSTELVFAVSPGRLTPASPATLRFLSQALDRAEEECALDRAGLDSLIGPENAARLHPLIGDLLRRGDGFRLEGADARGGLWSFVGETAGARALVRLVPMGRVSRLRKEAAAEQALPGEATRRDAADLEAMLAAAPEGVAAFDAGRRLLAANPTAQRLLRLAPDWVATRPSLRAFLDQLHRRQRMPEHANYAAWRDVALADPVERLGAQRLWALPNGDALRVSTVATPSGGFALFVADETSALTLERRINSAIGARRATIAAVDHGLAVVGADGSVQLLNPAFAEIWDLARALGPDVAERFLDDAGGARACISDIAAAASRSPEDEAIWRRIEAAALRREPPRRSERFEASRPSPDGADPAAQTISVRVTPLPDGASLIACADVSDAKAAEQALRDRAEALEAADRLKTDFLTDMAYQLRTPLNAVIGFADMLNQGLAGPLGDRQRDYVNFVLTAANDLRELIGDALDLGALRAGSLALRRAPFDLSAAAATVAAMAEKRAERRRALFVCSIAEEGLLLEGDERRLRHALFGALSAALNDAEPGDEARLVVRRAPAAPESPGAPEAEVQIALARRKARAAIASENPENGAPRATEPGGVSLTLARRIVEAHGGRCQVEEGARGLQAVFHLPLRSNAPDADEGPVENAAEAAV